MWKLLLFLIFFMRIKYNLNEKVVDVCKRKKKKVKENKI